MRGVVSSTEATVTDNNMKKEVFCFITCCYQSCTKEVVGSHGHQEYSCLLSLTSVLVT